MFFFLPSNFGDFGGFSGLLAFLLILWPLECGSPSCGSASVPLALSSHEDAHERVLGIPKHVAGFGWIWGASHAAQVVFISEYDVFDNLILFLLRTKYIIGNNFTILWLYVGKSFYRLARNMPGKKQNNSDFFFQ